MPTNPDQLVEIDGATMAIKDIPDPVLRQLFGLGHFRDNRPIVAGDWSYTPETCIYTGPDDAGQWIAEGTVLVCPGCGLDGT
jgi:hypothetical protein